MDTTGQYGERFSKYNGSQPLDQKMSKTYSQQSNWVPTCFTCGKKGHKSVYCPERRQKEGQSQVSHVITPFLIAPKYIQGHVGKLECKMMLDSGADRSVVHRSVVEQTEWLGKYIIVRGVVWSSPIQSRLAKIWIYTGDYSIPLVVATLESMQEKVLIGRDIGRIQ